MTLPKANFFCLLGITCVAPLGAQLLVSLPEQRESLLAQIESALAEESIAWSSANLHRPSPFLAVAEVEPPTPRRPKDPDPPVNQPVSGQRLSDRVALASVAPQFNPTGVIVSGNRRLLQMPGGKFFVEGDTFPAVIQEVRYIVEIERITPSGYDLRLGSARLPRQLNPNDADAAGRITTNTEPPTE
ncbi:MAG: hypothetical protein ACLFR7_01690 [Opitutales bacterium]